MIKKPNLAEINDILKLKNDINKYNSLANSFDYINLTLASPENIKGWCQKLLPSNKIIGEILNAETINFETKIPINYGLFCQKIFGPIYNWKCKCGKYKGVMLSKICEICNVQITESRVRRYKMGYISLPNPVCHFWYFNNEPAYLYILLKLLNPEKKNIFFKKLIYFTEYNNSFEINEKKNNFNIDNNLNQEIIGSEIILKMLENISNNLEEKIDFLRNQTLYSKSNYKILRILESFFATKTKPEWMLFTILPVLPPTLRPLVETENNSFASSDLNEFYRIIIYRINRYKSLIKKYNLENEYFFDNITIKALAFEDKKLIQCSIDSLIDNAKLPKDSIFTLNNRTLKSLTEILEGKYGRFRNTLLGKRVDYSGRSIIGVEPDLQLNECGIPYGIAIKIFKPFLINLLSKLNKNEIKLLDKNDKMKFFHIIIEQNRPLIWPLLEKLVENYSILLNRAPTLHKFGIQAFLPILISSKIIQLHPLVCTSFNADFDGDQMAVHLPLYESTQLEAKGIMRPCSNLFSPSNGEIIMKPSQDMIIGCYYLSLFLSNNKLFNNLLFSKETEVFNALYQKKISIHTPIFIYYPLTKLKLKIRNRKLFIYFSNILLENIKIVKILYKYDSKIFLLTNIGIFYGDKLNFNNYEIKSLFLQTTPGRLIFNKLFKNL